MRRKPVNIIFLTMILLCLGLITFFDFSSFLIVVLLFAWLAVTAIGSVYLRWNYHVNGLHSNPSAPEGTIALTFDDGPHPEYTLKVLDLLDEHMAKATFFCIGHKVESHPELVKEIVSRGHSIGNHTYSHDHQFGFFNQQKVEDELRRTHELVKSVTGLKMEMYRPAFGVTNPMISKAVKVLNLSVIGWSVRSFDTSTKSVEKTVRRVTKQLKSGDIILLHDDRPQSSAILEQLLLSSQQSGLRSITVDQLLEIQPYA